MKTLLGKEITAMKTNMQHMNLQHGVFVNFDGKHFFGRVKRNSNKFIITFLEKNVPK